MMLEEDVVYQKLGNEQCGFKAILKDNDKKQIHNLTEEETKIAEEAWQGAIEILQDALKKKNKVLMKVPEKVVLNGEEKDSFWMKRHAVLTEDLVKALLAELKKVTFKKDINQPASYARVNPRYETRTIYLCNLFWYAPKYLERNSQPGTLIHEVSHFLGTRDIAYGSKVKPTLYFACQGSMVKSTLRPARSSTVSPPKKNFWDALRKALLNADNVAYEFELTLNHRGNYIDGKYSCCGETAKYSVCDQSVPDSFHTCRVGEKWETENIVKEPHEISKNIEGKLRQLRRISDDMKESLRKAEVSRKIGLSINFAGGAVAAAGLILAPATFGLSAAVAGWVGVSGAGMALISMETFKTRATTKKEELDAIFADCRSFLNDLERVITLLNYEAGFQRDFGILSYSCSHLKNITIWINRTKAQIKSQGDDLQKIRTYLKNIIRCACLLKHLCKILCDRSSNNLRSTDQIRTNKQLK